MKKIFALSLLLLYQLSSYSAEPVRQVYGRDGSHFFISGSGFSEDNDPGRTHSYYGTNGKHYMQSGNIIYGSDGTTYFKSPGMVRGTDGTLCTQTGDTLFCH